MSDLAERREKFANEYRNFKDYVDSVTEYLYVVDGLDIGSAHAKATANAKYVFGDVKKPEPIKTYQRRSGLALIADGWRFLCLPLTPRTGHGINQPTIVP